MKKIRKAVSVILATILLIPYLSSFAWFVQGAPSVKESSESVQGFLNNKLPFIDPDLTSIEKPTRVILIVGEEANFSQIATYMVSCRVTPSFSGVRLIFGTVDASNIEYLASSKAIYAILKDREIDLMGSSYSALSQGNFQKNTKSLKPDVDAPKESPSGANSPNVTMREVVKIMNATSVWDEYGVTGEDVTIAIVDTGVDYGSLGLGYWDVIARDMLGYPAAFDADAMCLVYTNITLTAFSNASGTFIPTAGLDPLVYQPGMPAVAPPFSALTDDGFPSGMNVTGILENGQVCHWGVMFQWLFGLDLFPVLVVDSGSDGTYDTVYVDISFDWSWIPHWYEIMGGLWPFWSAPWPPDFSFADETPLTITESVGARDFTGDGIYDLSVSSLGYFLDVWGMSPNLEDRGLVLKPIDTNGNYTCFVYDFYGHGTSCASCAAGRELYHPFFGSGLAYDAKIMGVTALFIGDVIEGELWAAGFDLIPGTQGWHPIPGYGTLYGNWTYTGDHKADIISNSWGLSAWALYSWMNGVPWYDVLTMLEDALTIPGYLDPDYPGTIIVHAGGNGGSGYGTFTEPSYSTLTIGVGASTSMNWTQLYFGFAGGYYDDVISWSARGPTALGTVKPDVLGIGAFGFAPTAIFLGFGNGTNAFDLFGGTSMATPVVAGAAALVVQGFSEVNGFSPTHEIVKTILKSTAVDLGYDPFLQGAGRVDCYGAVSLAMRVEGAVVSSEATWQNVLEMIQIPAWINYQISKGLIPPYAPPPISDTSWFAGTVKPEENTTTEFDVYNPTSGDISVSVSAVTHKQIGSTILEASTGPMPDDWQALGWTWGNITILDKDLIPEDAELMTVSLVFPYDYFDPEKDYSWNQRLGVMIQDWNDTDADTEIDISEVWQINYGYNVGTSNKVIVGFPQSKFKGTPIIFVYQRNNAGVLESVPFKLYINFYKRAQWNWIELSSTSFTVSSDEIVSFNATLTVPSDAPQGVYEGQIMVNINGKQSALPVSVNVPAIIPTGQLVYNIETPGYDNPYNPFAIEGYFDWNWRYEAGDWKNWLFEFTNPSTLAAFIYADWEGNMTDVDMFSIHPIGLILDGTGNHWLRNGIFQWNTTTSSTEERVFMYTGALPEAPPLPELYTVLLHNVLFNGSTFPEQLSCSVKMINIDPASPAQITILAGESKSMTFNLSTGVKLTNVAFSTDFYFPVNIEPVTVEEIPEMGMQTINVTINVPSGVSPGRYFGTIYLGASEFPMGIPIYIYVDVPTTIETLDIKLDVGEIHFPGEIAQVYLQISNKGAPIHLMDTIPLKLWYQKSDGGFLFMNFDATLLDSGLYVAQFEVPVNATSCCLIVSIESYSEELDILYRGVSMDSFDISSTLINWNAYLLAVVGNITIIKTDIGLINANLTSINATLTDLILNSKGELVAIINTALGTIRSDLDNLNGTLKSINGTTVEIKTLLGPISTSIDTIGLKVTWIDDNLTLIKTNLGELRGTIESINGNVTTIKTDIGILQVNVGDIEGYVESLPQTASQNLLGTVAAVILSLIAAICSATLLFRLGKKVPS